jgi:hypothetical protein
VKREHSFVLSKLNKKGILTEITKNVLAEKRGWNGKFFQNILYRQTGRDASDTGTDMAGYLAKSKAGYRTSGEVGYRISSRIFCSNLQ